MVVATIAAHIHNSGHERHADMQSFSDDTTSQSPEPSPGKPFWHIGQCPAWCWGGHDDADHPNDRMHLSQWSHNVVLSLEPEPFDKLQARSKSEEKRGLHMDSTFEPEFLSMHLEQGYREIAPRVWLGFGETNKGHWLTPDEAGRVAEALLAAAEAANQAPPATGLSVVA